jgi:hypothetical protein
MNTFARSLISALALGGLLTLAGCGGGTGDNPNGGKAFNNNSGGGTSTGATPGIATTVTAPPVPPPPATGVPTMVMTLANASTGAATNTVPMIARAVVRDDNGVAVPNAVVTFAIADKTLATLVPASGTALTDATGTATVQVNAASLGAAGATTLTASGAVAGAAVSASSGFAIGAPNVTFANFTFGTNPLSAFGTTSVSVQVLSGGVPVTTATTVNFSSPCSGSGKAVLTASVLTGSNGTATASYRDNGCGGSDTITASVSGFTPTSSTLTLTVPTAGSIQFVSATPKSITLKGTGGAGRQESSQVVFKVVDTGGNPLSNSQTVNFSLSTTVGGITFANGSTTATAASDPTNGQAQITVNAGTVATPVRILASTTGAGGATLSTQSDQLTITTGIPDQAHLSVGADSFAWEGWNFDGTQSVLTVSMADHFSNPVPDGTTVNAIAEGGSIGNLGLGSCNTANGQCTLTMTSQAFRPFNGRVGVLVYALGEETFVDMDGDGLADSATELRDFNGFSSDLDEAWLDTNEDGVHNTDETFIDLNQDGAYTLKDGKYNGVLCNEAAGSTAGTCSAQKTIHIFKNVTMVMSGSFASFEWNAANITFGSCFDSRTVNVTIYDVNANTMPAGTTVAFSTTNGTITSPTTYTVTNNTACIKGRRSRTNPVTGLAEEFCTDAGFAQASELVFPVTVKTSSTVSNGICTISGASPGTLTVTVTTPKSKVTTSSIPVIN